MTSTACATAHRRCVAALQKNTARECCKSLGKHHMYPDMATTTAAAGGVLKAEMPGVGVPPQVIARLGQKVQRCPCTHVLK